MVVYSREFALYLTINSLATRTGNLFPLYTLISMSIYLILFRKLLTDDSSIDPIYCPLVIIPFGIYIQVY